MHLPKIANLNYKAQRARFEQMLEAEIVPYFKENSSLWKDKKQIVCAISYAWGNKEQEALVEELAEILEQAGLTILLDRWYDRSGLELGAFIEKMFDSDYILVIGTPLYLQKYEKVKAIENNDQLLPHFSKLTPGSNEHVLRAEVRIMRYLVIHSEQVSNRIIPLLWEGEKESALPFLLRSKLPRDFVNIQDSYYFEQVLILLKDLYSIDNRDKKYQKFLNNLNLAVRAIETEVLPVRDQYESQQQQEKDAQEKQETQSARSIIADLLSRPPTKRSREKELDDSPDAKRKKKDASEGDVDLLEDEGLLTVEPPVKIFGDSRKSLLVTIQSKLASNKLVVITGMQGVGKTQLMRKYAEINKNVYQANCYWLDAQSTASFSQAINALGKKLNKASDKNEQFLIKNICQELNKREKVLLIIDNAPSYKEINRLIKHLTIHVLVSSINEGNWPTFEMVRMDPMGEEMQQDAINYLVTQSNKSRFSISHQQAAALAKKLGYLQLAITQALHYIVNCKITVEDYIKEFDQNSKVILSQNTPNEYEHDEPNYPHAVYTVLEISLNKIIKEYSQGSLLIYTCSYFASSDIPKKILTEYFNNKFDFNKIMKLLTSFSLLETTHDHKTIRFHSLVQEIIRTLLKNPSLVERGKRALNSALHLFSFGWFDKPRQPLDHAVDVVSQSVSYKRSDENKIQMFKAMLIHAETVCEFCEEEEIVSEERAKLLHNLGVFYLDQQYDHAKAIKYLNDAKILHQTLESNDKNKAPTYRQLFKAFLRKAGSSTKAADKFGYFNQAEEYLSEYQKLKNVKTDEDKELCFDWASFYLQKIEFIFNKRWKEAGQNSGSQPGSSSQSEDSVNLLEIDKDKQSLIPAWYRTKRQRFQKTEEYLHKADKLIKEDMLSEKGMLEHYYGTFYKKRGHACFPNEKQEKKYFYDIAIEHYKKSLEYKAKLPDKRECSRTYHELGATYLKLKQFLSAIESLKEAVQLRLSYHRLPNHIEIASSLELLSEAYEKLNNFDMAIPYQLLYLGVLKNLGRKHTENKDRSKNKFEREENLLELYRKAQRLDEFKFFLESLHDEEAKSYLENKFNMANKQSLITKYFLSNKQHEKTAIKIEVSVNFILKLLAIDNKENIDQFFNLLEDSSQCNISSEKVVENKSFVEETEQMPSAVCEQPKILGFFAQSSGESFNQELDGEASPREDVSEEISAIEYSSQVKAMEKELEEIMAGLESREIELTPRIQIEITRLQQGIAELKDKAKADLPQFQEQEQRRFNQK